jgi:hypothetical protein
MAALALLLPLFFEACHKEEQAVVGVAQHAVSAEQKAQQAAQAAASERESQRAQLERIPLPTKSLYVDVHDANAWANPFLNVEAETMNLRVLPADAGGNTPSRSEAARRQQMQLRLDGLIPALMALPPTAWRYGRVIAVAESPQAAPKDRAKIRRNVEAAIKQLNDLGVVVQEWPAR